MKAKEIVVHDRMQSNYCYWLTEPVGRHFDPAFSPDISPKKILHLGVFGGKYMTDCTDEFPGDWFSHAKLSPHGYDKNLNFFGVTASQSLAEWRRKGWIQADDPRGWFQWYCRYFMGRRCEDDERQVKRWLAIRRHVSQVENHCEPGDLDCRPRQRQALLHWAYDSRMI